MGSCYKFRFTMARLDALPPAAKGKGDVYYDSQIPGLTVRVTAKGAKTFFLDVQKVQGRRGRMILGEFPTVSVEDARTRALRFLTY